MFGFEFFKINTTPNNYAFTNQEEVYSLYRPHWPKTFALEALKQADIFFDESTKTWTGLKSSIPSIVSIGSGTGADAEAFLQLGCKVYAVEPNEEFRRIACERFKEAYPHQFVSIAGSAESFVLPNEANPDLLVCAQSLHTFSSAVTNNTSCEAFVREFWRKILPKDNKNRISIWYYNLDPNLPAIIALDHLLKKTSLSYSTSKTPFVDAPLFEPQIFQSYIDADKLTISEAYPVDCLMLKKEQILSWLMSYSFAPKTEDEMIRVASKLISWFDKYKNQQDELQLPYIGFISQGPLCSNLLHTNTKKPLPPSPISSLSRQDAQANQRQFFALN